MSGYVDFEEARIKHLELIQAVISRLGNDGFLMKGWALTLAGALFGFAIDAENWGLALASLVPTLTFWGLDAYFLRCERLFRYLYARVRAHDTDITPFYMGATSPSFVARASTGSEEDVESWGKMLLRPTLLLFYGAIIVAALVILVIISVSGSSPRPPYPRP